MFLRLTEALTCCDIYLIQVECPVEELRRRERERGNRNPGLAEASLEYLYAKNIYDTAVDTAALSEAECVNRLLALLQKKPAAVHRANRNARDDT